MSESFAGQEPQVVLVEATAARSPEFDVQRVGLQRTKMVVFTNWFNHAIGHLAR